MSPGNFSGLRHGNTGSAEKSSNYSRNSYNESSHEHKRDYDSKSKREYDQQRDHLDNHGDNFNRNIYKQEESNRDFPNAPRDQDPPRRDIYKDDYLNDRREDSTHQEYYPDDTRESYKRDPSLLDRFSHLKSQQKQDHSQDYGNQDNRSSNQYNNPDNDFRQTHQTDSKNDRYEDRPAHLDKSGGDYSRRSDDYSRRSDERIDTNSRRTGESFLSEQGEGGRMHPGLARDNKQGSEYIPENKYDSKYGSSQKPQHENISLGQQQQPNFNINPIGMRQPFNAQHPPLSNHNSSIPPQSSNQFSSGPPGVYKPSPIPPPSVVGVVPPFQKHSQQPPLDFSKPPPGFNGPRPDFNKPLPGFNAGPVPDFTKPPPGFPGGPPPDFSKPPPNFQVPPVFQGNNQQPPSFGGPQAKGFPVGNFQNLPRPPASSSGPPTSFQNTQSYGNFQGINSQAGFPIRPPFQQQHPSGSFNYEQSVEQRCPPDQQNPESLANDDYSKIAQALQTIQSTNYDQTDEGSQYGGSQHEQEAKEKEKKSKKHKKQKKKEKKKEKKEKEIKRRLEEKLAELALLNNDDSLLQQEIGEKPPGSLSIQIKQPQSKFNLKIESPLMRGNIFQKYKDKKDSPLFAGKDHGERKYRRIDQDQQEDEDSDTDLEEEKQKANENEPQNKEELLQMLDLKQPATKTLPEQDDALYSGSEEGEVVSDEEELAERKRLKDMVREAKNEAMREPEFQPQSGELPSDMQPPAKASQPRLKKKVEKHPDSDGELSSDGEVSSDGELSDDSVDEFGRLKKFRSEPERISDDDRKYKYSSGSDSDTDEEKERWGKVQTE